MWRRLRHWMSVSGSMVPLGGGGCWAGALIFSSVSLSLSLLHVEANSYTCHSSTSTTSTPLKNTTTTSTSSQQQKGVIVDLRSAPSLASSVYQHLELGDRYINTLLHHESVTNSLRLCKRHINITSLGLLRRRKLGPGTRRLLWLTRR